MQGLLPRYISRFDIVDAHYWWYANHHEGATSASYARLSRMSRYYVPGPLAYGPESECAEEIYRELCEQHGCTKVFFSYETPVAAWIAGTGDVRTATNYSRTTSKHIMQWAGKDALTVEQAVIDALIA